MVTVIYGIRNTHYHPPQFLVCSLQGNFKNLGIGSAERSWGDVKTIKPGKRSDLGSDISEKQNIVYTYVCIEEARIGRTLSHTDTINGSHSHTCNDEDQAFDYQFDQWSVEKLFPNEDEAINREWKYIFKNGKKRISRISAKYQNSCFLKNTVVWL